MTERILWDNANISESYAGVTTPLTISFAKRVYREVYRGMARASGLPWSVINTHEKVFANLVGSRFGRLYYQLQNWYRFAQLFPGAWRNSRNLETMLTVQHLHDLRREVRSPWWFRLIYPSILLWRLLTFNREIRDFKRDIEVELKEIPSKKQMPQNAASIWQLYRRVADRILPRWHITTDNDFLVMTYTGALTGMLRRFNTGHTQELDLDVLNFHSTLPRQFLGLDRLRRVIKEDPSAKALLDRQEDVQLWDYLLIQQQSPAGWAFGEYLHEFGARLPHELKLETPSLEDQPHQLFSLLRAAVGESVQNTPAAIHDLQRYPWQFRWRIRWLISRAQYHLQQREETRLLRAKMFDVVRSLMLALGQVLVANHLLLTKRDIFWLEIDELPLAISGTMDSATLQTVINKRKQEYAGYESAQPPNRFWEEGGRITEADEKRPTSHPGAWHGLGASPGEVQGRVIVLEHPDVAEVQAGDILIATHTDPGWTPLFRLVSGAVIENGGLLSHASIVAREYHVPCVVQVPGITTELKTGQLIGINGATGQVTLLSSLHDTRH